MTYRDTNVLDWLDRATAEKPDREALQEMLGKEGTALTPLRPVGAVEFENGKMNVQSDGEFIEKGAAVRVLRVSGTTVYVKKI